MKYDQVSSKAGSGKKKGAAEESDAQEAKNLVDDMPVDEVAGASKGKKHHKKVVARKKGSAKKKGSADFKGGLHAKNTKHSESGEHLGAKRMGFTQNFGPARQNSYAQGAAKVASIMSFGASKGKGAASKGHGMDNEAHTHKDPTGRGDDRVFSLDVNSGSNIGDTNKSGYTTDFKPQHKDLGVVGRFENQTYMSSVGGSGSTYPGDHLSQVQSTGGPKGSVNKRGQVNPGFNFFSPSNSIDQKDLTQGAYVRDSRSGRPGGDGDTILTDYNQDGTMLGRGINALQKAFGYGESKTDTSKVYPKKS